MPSPMADTVAEIESFLDTGIAAIKGLIPMLWIQSKISPVQFLVGGIVVLLSYLFLAISPPHDPSEPPIIKPKCPVIGHLFGLLNHQVNYFSELFKRNHLPIATLPIGSQKLYVIFDAPLQQAALKSKDMDAQSFMVDFVPRIFGVKQGTVDKLLGKDGVHPNIMGDMEHVFKSALSGDNLQKLASTTLATMADTLNHVDAKKGTEVPNMFLWLQSLLSRSTSKALWGAKHNPFKDDRVIDAQWDFESHMGPLVLGFLPSIIARRAYLARNKVQAALLPYFSARHYETDPSTSYFIRARTRLLKKYDLPDDELAKNEVAITLVATTNVLSTLFWCIAEIWTRPDLLQQIRADALLAVFGDSQKALSGDDMGTRTITIPAAGLDAKCPLLASCFRESIRLASQIVTARRVLKDTMLTDPVSGNSYLLMADTNVMMPAKVVHRNTAVWGADAEGFNPRRFMWEELGPKVERQRKAAFVPFGGGKHMCPGRHFAFTENLALMAALAIGFDIEGLDKNKLRMGDSKRGETAKPLPGLEGGQVVLKKRKGWEGVKWEFSC
ncbi:cytochrome P450 [Pseudoneurospora amorphoporcata]|uniref:Cytochrome P450 n=1 Tax=Pseudoneurospora amorphoporcata TaxID=241081 RepID=A0AAN6SCH5_9PEZI|nr:cytochrome P450 [Pseudoneurospora amorphoporcata]